MAMKLNLKGSITDARTEKIYFDESISMDAYEDWLFAGRFLEVGIDIFNADFNNPLILKSRSSIQILSERIPRGSILISETNIYLSDLVQIPEDCIFIAEQSITVNGDLLGVIPQSTRLVSRNFQYPAINRQNDNITSIHAITFKRSDKSDRVELGGYYTANNLSYYCLVLEEGLFRIIDKLSENLYKVESLLDSNGDAFLYSVYNNSLKIL